jgi:hypothetical protein
MIAMTVKAMKLVTKIPWNSLASASERPDMLPDLLLSAMCMYLRLGVLADPITPAIPGAGLHPVTRTNMLPFRHHMKANGIELEAAQRVASNSERLSRPQFHGMMRFARVQTKKTGRVSATSNLNSSSPS